MNNFEKDYYEAEEFWKDGMIEDADNMIRIETTISMIPEGITSLADIGCGNGIFTRELGKLRSEINSISIDRSDTALSFVSTPKMKGDIARLPLKYNSFQCVTCLQVLEHLHYNIYENVLFELARVSSEYIIISVPYNENIVNRMTTCPKCFTSFNIDLHLRKYTSDVVNTLFNKFGFICKKKLNVVKKETFIGVEKYAAIRGLIKKKKVIFNSPICPVCGYTNTEFKTNNRNNILSNNMVSKKSIKNTIRKFWPKKIVDGYWMIALYEKNR